MIKLELMNEIDVVFLILILLVKGYIKVKDQQYLNFLYVGDRFEVCRELVRRMKKKYKYWVVVLFDVFNEIQLVLLIKIDFGVMNGKFF